MNRYRINKASNALWALETAQDKFNEAVENLSEEDFQVFLKQNDLKLEPSKAKERIKEALEKASVVTEPTKTLLDEPFDLKAEERARKALDLIKNNPDAFNGCVEKHQGDKI